jgi:hypothetical protein
LTDEKNERSMSDYLPPEEIVGLSMQIRAAVAELGRGMDGGGG